MTVKEKVEQRISHYIKYLCYWMVYTRYDVFICYFFFFTPQFHFYLSVSLYFIPVPFFERVNGQRGRENVCVCVYKHFSANTIKIWITFFCLLMAYSIPMVNTFMKRSSTQSKVLGKRRQWKWFERRKKWKKKQVEKTRTKKSTRI